ncbi:MAG: hypothetical protein FWC34_10675 [Bacteroidetes bacterium]|nr:hypothetical protein [Bacteroidota bacterium]
MITNISEVSYDDRIVAFVDILGFKDIIRKSERSLTKLQFLYQALEFLKRRESSNNWSLQLIEIEECAQKRGVENFDICGLTVCTCFSDSIVVSVKYDKSNINELTSTLIANLSYIGAVLMTKGILLRGGLTIGKLIHMDNGIIMGQALIDAHNLETTSAKYPRIIISDKLIQQLNYPIETKKNSYPYHQYLYRFEDGCVGFHQMIYFQVLQNSSFLNKTRLKKELKKIRKTIINGLDDSFENSEIHAKYQWLKKEYDKLIIFEEKEKIYEINEGLSGGNIHYSYSNDFYESRNTNNKNASR